MFGRSVRRMAGPSVVMLVVAALVAGASPPVAEAAGPQAFANFDYSMPDRYVDSDGDGLYPDPVSHVECTDPDDASSCNTIPPTLDVQPAEGWRIDLDACASTPSPDEATYSWSFADTGEPLNVIAGDEPCKFVTYFPDEGELQHQAVRREAG